FVQLMAFEAGRAREYYQRAWTALPPADARRLFAAEIMGRTYFALLRAIEARRFDVFSGRVTLPTPRRVAIALRCWLTSRWACPRRYDRGRGEGGGHFGAPAADLPSRADPERDLLVVAGRAR